MFRIERISFCFAVGIASCLAADVPQADWGRPKVEVKQAGDQWILQGQRLTVSIRSSNLAIQVKDQDTPWSMEGSTPGDLTVGLGGQTVALRLADAKKIEIAPYETGFKTGVRIRLSDYLHQEKLVDVRLQMFVCLQGPDEDLVCDLIAEEDKSAVKQCLWPGAFVPADVDATVVPFMQRMLLPKNWPTRV